jgi:hypothetical protein
MGDTVVLRVWPTSSLKVRRGGLKAEELKLAIQFFKKKKVSNGYLATLCSTFLLGVRNFA